MNQLYLSESHDPYLNLAIEDWLLRDPQFAEQSILFFYINRPAVVIGRSQNPWVECDLALAKKLGVDIVRRQSGGGTVYHDEGNLNFSFIVPKAQYEKTQNIQTIIDILNTLGIAAFSNERHDIRVNHSLRHCEEATTTCPPKPWRRGKQSRNNSLDSRLRGNDKYTRSPRSPLRQGSVGQAARDDNSYKISGSAFRETKDRAFHHATLLFNTNLRNLSPLLNPPEHGIEAKGVKSVRSPVINLSELSDQATIDNFLNAAQTYIQCSHTTITEAEAQAKLSIINAYHRHQSWDWIYGKTLPFSQTVIKDGQQQVIEVKQGIVTTTGERFS